MATVNDLTKKVRELTESFDELNLTRDALLAQLQCPVCLDTCLPPIFMCKNGHNLCTDCRQQVIVCPTCRAPGRPDIRNIFAEGVSQQFAVDCKFKTYGCDRLTLKNKMDEHLLDCLYRHDCWSCFNYHGDLAGLHQHVVAEHPDGYTVGEEFEGGVEAESLTAEYHSCHDTLFYTYFYPDEDGLRLYTWFLGPRRHVTDYHSWFKFVSQDGGFKISYRVPCSPTGKEFKDDTFVLMSANDIKRLKGEDGYILCKIKIERLNEL